MDESNKLKKVVDYVLIGLAFIIAIIFYFWFDLEGILWEKEEAVTMSQEQIDANRGIDHTGKKAGEGIVSLKTKEDWKDVLDTVDYVTVVPKNIIKTDVYSLAKWVGHYTKTTRGTSGRKLDEVIQTSLDISAKYSPYYIIELEDGSNILAQMNRGIAKKIQKGEKVELPIGKKVGLLQKAKDLLRPICGKTETSTDYVLYTINNEWESENANKILYIKVAVSAVLFLALAVILQLVVDKIAFEDKENTPKVNNDL